MRKTKQIEIPIELHGDLELVKSKTNIPMVHLLRFAWGSWEVKDKYLTKEDKNGEKGTKGRNEEAKEGE